MLRLFSTGNRPNFKGRNNLQTGDVCILHSKKVKFGGFGYKYCKVIDTIPSRDKLIRTVKVSYFNFPSKGRKEVIVDVRRLTLIQALCDQSSDTDHTDNIKSANVLKLLTKTCASNVSIKHNTNEPSQVVFESS